MSAASHDADAVPAPLLAAAIALVALTLLATALVRVTGIGADQAAPPAGAAAIERAMRFVDRDDGGIDVIDARDGRIFAAFEPGEDGFARATLRGLVRERKRADLGAETPFRLALSSDGRLVLDDPATGRFVDLRAFGATNAGAFARLLPAGGDRQ
ncbi:MAG: photosynthetic complex assembly protein PuhC [Tagaea sp.]|jgi:putative photosynthetic complex assembly protein